MSASLETPVALFVFNRPAHARRLLSSIARARPRQLLVVADGARADRPGEDERCRQTRAVIDAVDWPCEVRTHLSDVNLGCKRRIASGIDWVFTHVDEAILLEDDCLPDPSFFPFCAEMLARYRDDPRVHMVRGTNLLRGRRFGNDSYYFSNFYNIWGWATWARAWHGYDVDMRRWPDLRNDRWLERKLPQPEMAQLVRYFFDETHAGRVDTWDYQWVLHGWLHDRVAVVPATNLIANIGHGVDATHTHHSSSHLAELGTMPMDFPLAHPRKVQALAAADRHEWRVVYPGRAPSGMWARLRRRLGRLRQAIAGGTR